MQPALMAPRKNRLWQPVTRNSSLSVTHCGSSDFPKSLPTLRRKEEEAIHHKKAKQQQQHQENKKKETEKKFVGLEGKEKLKCIRPDIPECEGRGGLQCSNSNRLFSQSSDTLEKWRNLSQSFDCSNPPQQTSQILLEANKKIGSFSRRLAPFSALVLHFFPDWIGKGRKRMLTKGQQHRGLRERQANGESVTFAAGTRPRKGIPSFRFFSTSSLLLLPTCKTRDPHHMLISSKMGKRSGAATRTRAILTKES